jgi:hypothetical protein
MHCPACGSEPEACGCLQAQDDTDADHIANYGWIACQHCGEPIDTLTAHDCLWPDNE